MLLEKGEITDLLPCAGITLIRFYGYDLRLVPACRSILRQARYQTPRETLRNWLFRALPLRHKEHKAFYNFFVHLLGVLPIIIGTIGVVGNYHPARFICKNCCKIKGKKFFSGL